MPIDQLVATGNKGKCIDVMIAGAQTMAQKLFAAWQIYRGDQFWRGPGDEHRYRGHEEPALWRSEDHDLYCRFGDGHLWPLCGDERRHDDALRGGRARREHVNHPSF